MQQDYLMQVRKSRAWVDPLYNLLTTLLMEDMLLWFHLLSSDSRAHSKHGTTDINNSLNNTIGKGVAGSTQHQSRLSLTVGHVYRGCAIKYPTSCSLCILCIPPSPHTSCKNTNTHYQFPSSPWASALENYKVSAMRSRTSACNNEQTNKRHQKKNIYTHHSDMQNTNINCIKLTGLDQTRELHQLHSLTLSLHHKPDSCLCQTWGMPAHPGDNTETQAESR